MGSAPRSAFSLSGLRKDAYDSYQYFLNGLIMQVLVQKYGGTSLGTLERISGVAKHIQDSLTESGCKLVVVVSAMGTYTDELIQMGLSLNPSPPKREWDMLLSAGERISASLLSIALDRIGIRAVSLTGSQSGILTDSVHGNARITQILGHRIRDELKEHNVIIIAGFQGVSPETKNVTTLGRGGSDLTALALALSLEAQGCEIYTDVPGVMSADPRKVPSAKKIPKLSWNIMGELASAGAGVVHHRAAVLAQKYKIPFEIRHSQFPKLIGTKIEGETMETPQVIAVTSKTDQALVRIAVQAPKLAGHLLTQGLHWLWKQEQSPCVYRSYPSEGHLLIEAIFDRAIVDAYLKFQDSQAKNAHGEILPKLVDEKLAVVTIVGVGFRQAPEIVQKALSVFGEDLPQIFEVKDHSIVMTVSPEKEQVILQKLHTLFFG